MRDRLVWRLCNFLIRRVATTEYQNNLAFAYYLGTETWKAHITEGVADYGIAGTVSKRTAPLAYGGKKRGWK